MSLTYIQSENLIYDARKRIEGGANSKQVALDTAIEAMVRTTDDNGKTWVNENIITFVKETSA